MLGKLIVLEGIDGSGTTTQTKALADYLKQIGFKVLSSAEPTKSEIGQFIKQTMNSDISGNKDLLVMLALCFAADRMHHLHNVIRPALSSHDYVLLDRYVLSSIVYQGIHLPSSFVSEINQYALVPDLNIILDLDVELAIKRVQLRNSPKDFYEKEESLKKCRARYLKHMEAKEKNTVLVDASGTESQVLSHIINIVKNHWSNK